jgi:hypothetical protein
MIGRLASWAVALTVTVMLLSGCRDLLQPQEPPFVYRHVDLVTGKTDQSEILAVRYSLYNRTDRAFSGLELSFYLWDSEGAQYPGVGDNFVEVSFSGSVPALTSIEITSSLDEVVLAEPRETLAATEFGIRRVEYAEGGAWEDRYRQFGYPHAIVSVPAEYAEAHEPNGSALARASKEP